MGVTLDAGGGGTMPDAAARCLKPSRISRVRESLGSGISPRRSPARMDCSSGFEATSSSSDICGVAVGKAKRLLRSNLEPAVLE